MIVVFKGIWEAQSLFPKTVLGSVVCKREEKVLVNLDPGAPGPTYMAFSCHRLLILFFGGKKERAGVWEWLKHMD